MKYKGMQVQISEIFPLDIWNISIILTVSLKTDCSIFLNSSLKWYFNCLYDFQWCVKKMFHFLYNSFIVKKKVREKVITNQLWRHNGSSIKKAPWNHLLDFDNKTIFTSYFLWFVSIKQGEFPLFCVFCENQQKSSAAQGR